MDESNVIPISKPQESTTDALTAILRQGAQQLLSKALEAEIESLLSQYSHLQDQANPPQVVRNGYLPERTIQTGIGPIQVKVPRVRDRGSSGVKFTSRLIPPYLRRSKNIEELLPVFYLKGISSGDFNDPLTAIVGPAAAGMSSSTICRLKEDWSIEYHQWRGFVREGAIILLIRRNYPALTQTHLPNEFHLLMILPTMIPSRFWDSIR